MEAHESKHAMQEAEQEEIVSENKLVESIAIPVVLNVVAMKHTGMSEERFHRTID